MRIQKDWGEMTMLCKGLQGRGIENVALALLSFTSLSRNLLFTPLPPKIDENKEEMEDG